jgi:hypothetical protein
LNRDGVVGGHRVPLDGGKLKQSLEYKFRLFFSYIGLIGKIEKAAHIDINKDGYIGGPPVYYPPPQAHKKH